jgi:2-polyprenyl-3-methyl-5-hydroxy-6-metoxy-1,4-benzoquinol methylase
MRPTSTCRFCDARLTHSFADLGMSPLANRFLREDQLDQMEPFYPLHALVCERCLLVQLEQFETPDAIFSDYPYFSSFSSTWLEHCKRYADMAVERFALGPDSQIVELASNDGYLLQYFVEKKVPVLGIEPAANVAEVAIEHGIPTVVEFFGSQAARKLATSSPADLLIGNNVLAHVPDLNDFVAGMKILLKAGGVITMEFPHLMRLVEDRQFDTIYHEHFSYFSFHTARQVFAAHALTLFDVEELPTHGGSLRIFGGHAEDDSKPVTDAVEDLERREREAGLLTLDTYLSFPQLVQKDKREVVASLIALKDDGKTIAGYGAPAKGNTLLNFCGIGTDFIDYTVDANPHKQGLYLPGTHIPIRAPESIRQTRPDVVFILPWNVREEIIEQYGFISDWGGQFIVRSPRLEVLDGTAT